jgi:hypothetical protein
MDEAHADPLLDLLVTAGGMSDAEAAGLDAIISTLSVRERLLWQAARWLWNDDARVLAAADVMALSPARVAELLAYDPDARGLQG